MTERTYGGGEYGANEYGGLLALSAFASAPGEVAGLTAATSEANGLLPALGDRE